jgi:hypothetical protein
MEITYGELSDLIREAIEQELEEMLREDMEG